MRIKTCKACGEDFDPDAPRSLGAGVKYCTVRCRNTRGGLKDLGNNTRGRKPRFPRALPIHKGFVRAALLDSGMFVEEAGTKKDPDRLLAYKGSWLTVRIGIGGNARRERWADVIAFYDQNRIRYESACTSASRTEHSIDASGRPQKRIIKTQCRREECRKCLRHRFLIEIIKPLTKVG